MSQFTSLSQAVAAYRKLTPAEREARHFAWLKSELKRQEQAAEKKGHSRTAGLRLADQLVMEAAGL